MKSLDEKHLFEFPQRDKVVHFLMYFGLSIFAFSENYLKHNFILHREYFFTLIVLIILAGGSIELFQKYFTIDRSGDIYDMLANTCGLLIALLIFWKIKKSIHYKNMLSLLNWPKTKA